MCFCTTGFETYAAYALLVAKALWRDGMVYVLLLLVSIPDSSSVLRTHKPIRNCVYLFIMMLSFQLSKVTYLSTQLLVYMATEASVHQPTSSFFFFLRFNMHTYLWTHLLVHVPTDLPTPKYMYLLILILSFRLTTKTYRSTQPRVHIPIDATVFHPTCSFWSFHSD